jgi:HCOMODA/2-hydroxy-3-carboxy-muconic semialdehyde decarboxylase
MIAVYLQVNARIQLEAIRLGSVNYLTPEEVENCTRRQLSPLSIDRAWDYWKMRSGCAGM